MKQILLGVLVFVGILLQAPPVQADSLDNFRFKDYDIRYVLKRTSNGHSQLKTIETITAEFPNYDQNHGIERAIPNTYRNHPTNLVIDSVEKADGTPWNYSTNESNNYTVLRIGDASQYVQGTQTYVIRYTQQDVTHLFADTRSNEFYWDTNGTEWRVPTDRLTVSLAVDESLTIHLTGMAACYKGSEGQNGSCNIEQAANIFTTEATNLAPGENLTVAIGFTPETFTEYQPSLLERLIQVWIIVTVVGSLIAVGIMIWLFVRYAAWSGRKKDIGTIVPEYIPPKDASLSTVASIVRPQGSSVFTAQLIDFAVRHYLKIFETGKKSLFKSADYTVEVAKDISSLTQEEQEILTDIYGGPVSVGMRLDLSSLKNNTTVYSNMSDNDKKLTGLVRGLYALREKNPSQSGWYKKIGWVLLISAALTLNPVMLIASLSAFICEFTLWPLTDKGVALRRYAEGMKMYIHVAEAERIKLLQSPEGVAKVGAVDVNQPGQLLKLYERMLPYAILFDQEKEWSKRIGGLYETTQTSPDWYAGNTAFNAAVFATAINSFSNSVTYSTPSSSSSGGSGGGGFSGGGGGGGGGGGW